MTLIKSISGIRGTIGGPATENLTPLDIVKFTTAYVRFIAESAPGKRLKIVVGRAPVFRAKWSATSSKARCSAAVRM